MFKTIPDFNLYEINKDGDVRVKETGFVHKGSRNPKGYINYRLIRDDGHRLTIGRHRLIMLTFSPIKNSDEMIVNHINGIKGDDRFDNLEWTTYTGNIEHAGAMGLTEKCKPVDLMIRSKNEIIRFPSIKKMADYLNVSKDTLVWRLRYPESEVWDEDFSYRYFNASNNWLESKLERKPQLKKMYVKHLLTGKEETFKSRHEFGIKYSLSDSFISTTLTKFEQPVIYGFIQLKTTEDTWIEYDDFYKRFEEVCGVKLFTITDKDGVSKMYQSLKECSEDTGIGTTTIHYRLNNAQGKIYPDGKTYQYYSSGPNIQ